MPDKPPGTQEDPKKDPDVKEKKKDGEKGKKPSKLDWRQGQLNQPPEASHPHAARYLRGAIRRWGGFAMGQGTGQRGGLQ